MTGLIEVATLMGISVPALITLVLIMIWDGIWKIVAMWKAAKKKQLAWFIALALLNTVGILPILYVYLFSNLKLGNKKAKKKKR